MTNFLKRVVAVVIALVLAAAALVFASVVLALAAALAIVLGGWLWWHTRQLRREIERSEGAIVEGEYRVERETRRLDR